MADHADRAPSRHATEPMYNIKAVVQRTHIPADTMRAWERRYGFPRPQRTETGRRLYSERDIALLRWLRARTDAGMTISQAVEQFRSLGDAVLTADAPARAVGPRTFTLLRAELLAALLAFDRPTAEVAIEEAFGLYPVEEVCLELLMPVLVEVGERWHRHEATVAQEHFASYVIERRLASLLHLYTPAASRGLIVAACAPDELHEIGLLVLAVFLARRGWQVVYLGANVPIPDLVHTVTRLRPDLVCLSAMNASTAETLRQAVEALRQLAPLAPSIAYGGRHFNTEPAPREAIQAHYVGADARDAVARIEQLLA